MWIIFLTSSFCFPKPSICRYMYYASLTILMMYINTIYLFLWEPRKTLGEKFSSWANFQGFFQQNICHFPFFSNMIHPTSMGWNVLTLKSQKLSKDYIKSLEIWIFLKTITKEFMDRNLIISNIHQGFYTLKKLWILGLLKSYHQRVSEWSWWNF